MLDTDHITPLFASRGRRQALETWRDAAHLVASRWQGFLEADPASRTEVFASFVAALDAEEAAAFELAARSASTIAA